LTGLNASETQIDVIGNNLANANTVGFKASDVVFANQDFLQTQSVELPDPLTPAAAAIRAARGPGRGGRADHAQFSPRGTISAAQLFHRHGHPGRRLFHRPGRDGQQSYTRNGTFTTNAQDQLVTATGNRLMGFGVNSNFEIDASQLQPLTIPWATPWWPRPPRRPPCKAR